MDVFTDPKPATYQTWAKFTLPDNTGGKTAFAMTTSQATQFTALYTFFIMGIFMVSWNILISIVLLCFTPKKMSRTSYVTIVAAWNANDPLQATLLMVQHIFHILGGMLKKKYKAEFNFDNLMLDLAVFFVAAGTFAGSFALGLLFPGLLIVGSYAPVNPDLMYYPNLTPPVNQSKLPEFVKLNYASMGALRAFGAIEGSEVTINRYIDLKERSDQPWQGNGRGVERYIMDYGYNLTGADMGLQNFGRLNLKVKGSCSFADDWWEGEVGDSSNKTYDRYNMWKGNQDNIQERPAFAEINPSSPPLAIFSTSGQGLFATNMWYSILPVVAGKLSVSESLDPWYETKPNTANDKKGFQYKVASRRPPLKCVQNDEWSYDGWKGTSSDLFDGGQAPVKFPEAIRIILRSEFGLPMIVNIGRALQAGAIKSSTRIIPGIDMGIDPLSSSALKDMQRIVLAAYLSTRSIFRDSAMAGLALGTGRSDNQLRLGNGLMKDGVGDVVIESSAVSTIRLGYFAAVPSILAFLIILSGLFRTSRTFFGCYDGTFYPNRYNRFIQFISGLHATQLCRMVDQILAQVDIPDDDNSRQLSREEMDRRAEEHKRHKKQAIWFEQISPLPQVHYASEGCEDPDKLVFPQLRAVKVAGNHRLTLRAQNGNKEDFKDSHWKKLKHEANNASEYSDRGATAGGAATADGPATAREILPPNSPIPEGTTPMEEKPTVSLTEDTNRR